MSHSRTPRTPHAPSRLQMSRRGFARLLFAGGLAGAGALSWRRLLSLPATAQPSPAPTPRAPGQQGVGAVTEVGRPLKDRYFVLCMFDGGWDTLVGLDPRDPQVFTDQAATDTKITLGYNRLSDIPALGLPSVGGLYLPARLTQAGSGLSAPLGAYMGDLATPGYVEHVAVVRGVNMSTLAHDVGKVRARTGRPPSGNQPRGSSVATWLARHYQGDELIPNLSIGEEVYNLDQPLDVDVFEVSAPLDLRDALTPSAAVGSFSPETLARLEALVDEGYPCADPALGYASPFRSSARLSLSRVRRLLEMRLSDQLNLAANTEDMAALRGRFGFDTSSSASAGLTSPAAKAALAARALTSGLARVVSVNLVGSLDTHYGYGEGQNWLRQGGRQLAGWQAIARLMDELRRAPVLDGSGETFFDRTTIVAYSDFGRTAMLNPAGGRDHWLTSAYFLAGADIAGGVAFGASSDVGMTPTLVDPMTGVVSALQGEEMRPEHVWQTLLCAAGFDMARDPADLRVRPLLPLLRGGA